MRLLLCSRLPASNRGPVSAFLLWKVRKYAPYCNASSHVATQLCGDVDPGKLPSRSRYAYLCTHRSVSSVRGPEAALLVDWVYH